MLLNPDKLGLKEPHFREILGHILVLVFFSSKIKLVSLQVPFKENSEIRFGSCFFNGGNFQETRDLDWASK